MKKVSVIIPVYNMAELIEKNIRYITEQTYKNLEILLINDGSKDDSLKACRCAAKEDKRIIVLDKENGGPGDARNFGLHRASGEYVYFFDIDDGVKPQAIEKLVTAMETQGVDLAACGFEMFDGKKIVKTVRKTDGLVRTGEETRRDYYEQLFMGGERGIQGALWYKLFRLSVIRENNIEFPDFPRSEDVVFTAKYVNFINGFTLVGDVLYTYNLNNSGQFWDKYPKDMYATAKKTAEFMLETVYGWNRDNKAVRDGIYQCFFGNVFECLYCIFNPRLKWGIVKRYRRLKEISKDAAAFVPEDVCGINHSVYGCMRKKRYAEIYIRMRLHILKRFFG